MIRIFICLNSDSLTRGTVKILKIKDEAIKITWGSDSEYTLNKIATSKASEEMKQLLIDTIGEVNILKQSVQGTYVCSVFML